MKRKQAGSRDSDKKRLKIVIDEYNFADKESQQPKIQSEKEVKNKSVAQEEQVLDMDDQDKLFVGLSIPQEVQNVVYERLQEFTKNTDCCGCIWQKNVMMHMTLSYIGNASRADVIESLTGLSSQKRFQVSLESFSHRGTAKLRLMTAPNDDLVSLTKEVINRTGKGDITRFKGHISLAVLRGCDQAWVDQFIRQVESIDLSDISWVADEICLFSSLQRPYTIRHRIPLKRTPNEFLDASTPHFRAVSIMKPKEVAEKPAGKRFVGSSVQLVFTKEQQLRLGINEHGAQAFE